MVTEYQPPELGPVSGLPAGAPPALTAAKEAMTCDLTPHAHEFDAIVCAGDFHGVALAAVAAAKLSKTLVIVCKQAHGDSAPQVKALGEFRPEMRLLYVDDFFCLGASWRHVADWLARYGQATVVATYAAQVRDYRQVAPLPPGEPATGHLSRTRDALVADLLPHARKFEAIVCAWDPEGTALAAVAAAWLGKALVIVCTHGHEDVVSHIVTIGDFDPRMRLLCMCPPGDVSRAGLLGYLSQSARPNIAATYEATGRDYQDANGAQPDAAWDVAAMITQLRQLYPDREDITVPALAAGQ